MKRPPLDIALDGDRIYVTLPLTLVRDRGNWSEVETLDGIVIGTLLPHRIPDYIREAVEEAEREGREPVLMDQEWPQRGRA